MLLLCGLQVLCMDGLSIFMRTKSERDVAQAFHRTCTCDNERELELMRKTAQCIAANAWSDVE